MARPTTSQPSRRTLLVPCRCSALPQVAEAHFGAAKRGWGQQRLDQLEQAIRRYLVAPYDDDLARLWGRLKAQAQRSGHPLGQNSQTNDLWICATAVYHNAPLLTLNRRHFANFPGLVLLS